MTEATGVFVFRNSLHAGFVAEIWPIDEAGEMLDGPEPIEISDMFSTEEAARTEGERLRDQLRVAA